jgi:hypothetical protein
MKRFLSCTAMAAALLASSAADAGLFFGHRVVVRPVVVRRVVVTPAPAYYVGPAPVVYTPAPVVYAPAPVVYSPVYYAPAPVYVARPVTPVYYGW